MLNSVCLIGRAVADCKLLGKEESQVASFDLAIDSGVKNADGTYRTSFVQCKAFGSQKDVLAKSLKKGEKVGITGRLVQVEFIRRDGTKASTLEVYVEKVELLSKKQDKEDVE